MSKNLDIVLTKILKGSYPWFQTITITPSTVPKDYYINIFHSPDYTVSDKEKRQLFSEINSVMRMMGLSTFGFTLRFTSGF